MSERVGMIDAIKSLRPNAAFALRGDDLEWLDEVTAAPTAAEIAAEMQRLAQAPAVHAVSKVTVIRRLQAAGKFNAALNALKADPLLYEIWSAVLEIRSDDANARALFTAVGADPAVILAPETP